GRRRRSRKLLDLTEAPPHGFYTGEVTSHDLDEVRWHPAKQGEYLVGVEATHLGGVVDVLRPRCFAPALHDTDTGRRDADEVGELGLCIVSVFALLLQVGGGVLDAVGLCTVHVFSCRDSGVTKDGHECISSGDAHCHTP